MITVVKRATTFLCRIIAIQKLNNIIINCLTNPQLSVLLKKWRLNTSQNWEVLGDNFNSVNLDGISENILQALGFYHSPFDYLKKRVLRFANVIDKLELAIEPKNTVNQS